MLPRMLTIKEVVAECKGTGLTEYCIRKLVLSDKIVHIRAGNKILINYDKFIDYLNNPSEKQSEKDTKNNIRMVQV